MDSSGLFGARDRVLKRPTVEVKRLERQSHLAEVRSCRGHLAHRFRQSVDVGLGDPQATLPLDLAQLALVPGGCPLEAIEAFLAVAEAGGTRSIAIAWSRYGR